MNNPFLNRLLIHFLAIFFGVLLTFAFAPFSIFPFAVIATMGLLILLIKDAHTPKRAFWYGFLFGLGLFGSGIYWVYISIHLYGDVPSPVAFLITSGLVAILAIFPGATCALTQRYFPSNNSAKTIFAWF